MFKLVWKQKGRFSYHKTPGKPSLSDLQIMSIGSGVTRVKSAAWCAWFREWGLDRKGEEEGREEEIKEAKQLNTGLK